MLKTLLRTILILSFTFSLAACTRTVTVPVYVEAQCPKIEVLKKVDKLEVEMDHEGRITAKSTYDLIRGAGQLRRSESYYIEQITKYNKEFDKSN